MEKIMSYVKNNKYQSLLYFFGLIGFIILIGHIIYIQCFTEANILDELGSKERPLYLVNIAIVLAALATAIFTWWKNNINQRMSFTQEVIRQDSLFAKAVEFLKDEKLITQKAGVHILKDLAVTSPQQTQKCLDLLCSLNEIWMPIILNEYPYFFQTNDNFSNIKNIENIELHDNRNENNESRFLYLNEKMKKYINDISLSQLVLQSLSEIIKFVSFNPQYKGQYYLSYRYLCSIELRNINFKKFKLSEINLRSADLSGSDLQSANLELADLQFAKLRKANLNNVNLSNADIQFAKMLEANLSDADLTFANLSYAFLTKANLQNSDLDFANLLDSDLSNSNLKYANLSRCNLQSANLSEVNLQFSKLFDAKLQSANLENANLQYSDINSADFTNSLLIKTDFRNAKNIDTAKFDDNRKFAIFTDEDYKRMYNGNN